MEDTLMDVIAEYFYNKYADEWESRGIEADDIIPIVLDKYEEQIFELEEELESAIESEI